MPVKARLNFVALRPIVSLVLWMLVGLVLAGGIFSFLGPRIGVNLLDKDSLLNGGFWAVALMVGIQQFLLFLLPGWTVLYVYPALRPDGILGARVDGRRLGLVVVLFLVSLPLVSYLNWLNLQFPLADQWQALEEEANRLIATLLKGGNVPLLVLLIGLLPALGEEMVFRGVIQRSLVHFTGRPHVAVWLAAAIFSGIHMQFAGFLPRLFLGAALGYAYHYSGALWVSVLLHFFFNGVQAVYMAMHPDMIDQIGAASGPDRPPALTVLGAAAVFILVLIRLEKHTGQESA